MRSVGYAFPWDYLDDPAAAARSSALGLDAVALAATYHAARTASPLHPTRRVTEVLESACYVPVRETTWRGRRLAPRPPTWIEHDDLFNEAASALAGAGVPVAAWIVLTHDDALGLVHPDLAVRNAFGDRYSYALCPSSQEVRDYGATLVGEVLTTTSCEALVLEACGPMGVEHSSLHEKTDGAHWGVAARQLLSLCFCQRCAEGMSSTGLEVTELAALVREGVDKGVESVASALGTERAELVARFRRDTVEAYRGAIIEGARRVRPEVALTLHASPDRWATGSFSALATDEEAEGISALVANCWDEGRAEIEIAGLASRGDGRPVGAYLRLDRVATDEEEREAMLARYHAAGMSEAHLYHLGLVDARGLRRAREVVEWMQRTGETA